MIKDRYLLLRSGNRLAEVDFVIYRMIRIHLRHFTYGAGSKTPAHSISQIRKRFESELEITSRILNDIELECILCPRRWRWSKWWHWILITCIHCIVEYERINLATDCIVQSTITIKPTRPSNCIDNLKLIVYHAGYLDCAIANHSKSTWFVESLSKNPRLTELYQAEFSA